MKAKIVLVRLTAATLLAAICLVPTTVAAAKQKKQLKHPAAAAPAAKAQSAVISGTVKNRAGHGVGGATLLLKGTAAHTNHLRSGAGRRTRTGSGGGFTLRTAPGRYAVIASKRGVGRQRVNIAPGAGSVTHFTVILGSHHHSHHRHLHFRHRRVFVPVRVPTPKQSIGTSGAPK